MFLIRSYPPSKHRTNQAIIDGLQKLLDQEKESFGSKHMRATYAKVCSHYMFHSLLLVPFYIYYIFIYLYIYIFIYLYIYIFIYLYIYIFIYLYIYIFIYLYIYIFIYLYIYIFMYYLFICSFIHLFIYSSGIGINPQVSKPHSQWQRYEIKHLMQLYYQITLQYASLLNYSKFTQNLLTTI